MSRNTRCQFRPTESQLAAVWTVLVPCMQSTLTCVLLVSIMSGSVFAQYGLNVERLGLETVWSKAIMTGLGNEISGVNIYVSPNKSYSATEVVDRFGRTSYFSGRELGTSRGGYDQMARLAELRSAELAARGLDPMAEVKQIPEVTMYIRSELGTVTAIDAETGEEKWTTKAGTAGYPSHSVAATDDYVAVISSSKLFLLDANSGEVLESMKSKLLPSATPSIDGQYLYVPTRRGVVQVRSTEDLGRLEYTLGSGGPVTSPLTIGRDSVSWTTKGGKVYVANVAAPGWKFHFQASDEVVAEPIYMDGKIFVTSIDGFVYAVSEETGATLWNFSAGGPLRDSPMAVGGNVYATTDDGQANSINAETGQSNWSTSGVDRFVAASDSRIYCMTKTGDLAALDIKTGGRIAALPISKLGTVAVNANTDRIYLIGNNGVVQCLREQGHRWPTTRMPPRSGMVEETAPEVEAKAGDAPDVPSAGGELAGDSDFTDDSGMDDGFEDGMADDETVDDGMEDDSDPFAGDDSDPFAEDFGDSSGDDVDSDPFGDDPF